MLLHRAGGYASRSALGKKERVDQKSPGEVGVGACEKEELELRGEGRVWALHLNGGVEFLGVPAIHLAL